MHSLEINPGDTYSGDATYYGAGQDSRGACGGNKLPTGPGGMATVALNSPMYGNGENCGICLKGHGINTDCTTCGYTPKYNFLVTVNNLCPECSAGDLDFAENGDGRWRITWTVVDCASARRRLLAANETILEETQEFLRALRGEIDFSKQPPKSASRKMLQT
eukprot:jgi/Botrbrau1/19928/Bobra.0059s0045.1